MTTHRKREIAKFACGAESFHAFTHAILLFTGTTMTLFGISFGPVSNVVGLTVNSLIALALASYAWGIFGRRAQAGHAND
ncbi:MAG: hypothetical protein UZ17_ACD001002903 [Acidobacteria bacterium OLB17]|nr:MAG: hypothetical protein UZ17_ACD001002903 [Acidobacteria bacterium OLB17]